MSESIGVFRAVMFKTVLVVHTWAHAPNQEVYLSRSCTKTNIMHVLCSQCFDVRVVWGAPLHNYNIYKVKLLNNHQSKFWWYTCSSNSCFCISGGMVNRILIVCVWTGQYPSLYVCEDVWCGSCTHKLTITYTPTFQCVAFLAENLDCLRSMTIHTQSWIWKARWL